ncbi:MAG: cyclic nucleotide-binding domain-containing protein [Hyphomicrobiaceae bacterium]|nr:cyclic nucleotide-binding domain-containing protein [Hyphomicrobiaceae bacterium]
MAAHTEATRFLPYLRPEEERKLIQAAPQRRYAADELILEQNTILKAIFLVETGAVRIERHEDGVMARLATLLPGECFGEMSFVDGNPTSARVVADEPSVIRLFSGESIAAMESADPTFTGRLYHSIAAILSERLRLTSAHLDTLIAGVDFFSEVKSDLETAIAKLPGRDWRSDLISVMAQREKGGS